MPKKWYRGSDIKHNRYFCSKEDLKLLFSSDDIYGDATFSPVSGFKRSFPELYILSVRKELGNKKIVAVPCVFVLATSKTETNYKLMLKTIKEFVRADLEDGGPDAELSPLSFYVDFEISMINAISEVFPSARINNCFFHTLQAWRRKLCQLGFKRKLEKNNKFFDPTFREFFDFISGIPSLNLHVSSFRKKILTELENYKTSLNLDKNEKENFLEFVNYLVKYYLSDNSKFHFRNWEQYSAITQNPDFSRTTNISESIHSSLNKNFPRKTNFNNAIEKIFNFKKESVMSNAALDPKKYFLMKKKPSQKRSIRPSDLDRLSRIYEKVIAHNNLSYDHQLYDLKEHSIELGGMRRYAYESSNLWVTESDSES